MLLHQVVCGGDYIYLHDDDDDDDLSLLQDLRSSLCVWNKSSMSTLYDSDIKSYFSSQKTLYWLEAMYVCMHALLETTFQLEYIFPRHSDNCVLTRFPPSSFISLEQELTAIGILHIPKRVKNEGVQREWEWEWHALTWTCDWPNK